MSMIERHFAFFAAGTGEYLREWAGPVPVPDIPHTTRRWWGGRMAFSEAERQAALNAWATRVSQPQPGEVGLDVTPIGWPVGDLCYCRVDFSHPRPLLQWGPPRHYIEVRLGTMQIVANTETHRPLRAAVPGQVVIDITGTALARYHGRIWGRFACCDGRWALEPLHDVALVPRETQRAIADARIDLDVAQMPVSERARVAV